jgi:hypothetical protein
MKKYVVEIFESYTYECDVKAHSPEEAEEKASKLWIKAPSIKEKDCKELGFYLIDDSIEITVKNSIESSQ